MLVYSERLDQALATNFSTKDRNVQVPIGRVRKSYVYVLGLVETFTHQVRHQYYQSDSRG